MNFPEAWNVIKRIPGWLTRDEALFLFESAQKTVNLPGVIVEIGSWKGRSAVALAYGLKSVGTGTIYAIDPCTPFKLKDGTRVHTPPEEFIAQLKRRGVTDVVVPVIKTSSEAHKQFNDPIKLLYIDGDHSYESALEDYDLWTPHVVKGGIVVLHDTVSYPGVKKVVETRMADKDLTRVIEMSAYVED